jgi:hypothetical protein
MTAFTPKTADTYMKAALEGGCVELIGPDSDPEQAERNAKADALYLVALYQALIGQPRPPGNPAP